MRRLVSELLKIVDQSEDKVRAIKEAAIENPAIVDVLKVNFDPEWEFNLPESYPEKFKLDDKTPYGLSITELIKDRKKLQIFRKHGPYATLDQSRRETIFLNFLESLHHTEAEILVFAKDKALNELFPWLTKDFHDVLYGLKPADVLPQVEQTKSQEEPVEAPVELVKSEVKSEDSQPVEKPKKRGRPKKGE